MYDVTRCYMQQMLRVFPSWSRIYRSAGVKNVFLTSGHSFISVFCHVEVTNRKLLTVIVYMV